MNAFIVLHGDIHTKYSFYVFRKIKLVSAIPALSFWLWFSTVFFAPFHTSDPLHRGKLKILFTYSTFLKKLWTVKYPQLSALLKSDSLPSENNLFVVSQVEKKIYWVVKGVCSITMEVLAQFLGQDMAHREVTVDFYITAWSAAFKWKPCFYS